MIMTGGTARGSSLLLGAGDIEMQRHAEERRYLRMAWELARQAPIIFDTETTGIGRDSEIVEIAFVDLAGRVWFESLVKPSRPIPADSTRIHGITDSDVAGSLNIFSLLPEIVGVLQDRIITSYNLEFDSNAFLRSLNSWEHLPHTWDYVRSLTSKWSHGSCIMKIFSGWYGEWSDRRNDYNYKSLREATERLRVGPPTPEHRAKGDALAAARILASMAEMGEPPAAPILPNPLPT